MGLDECPGSLTPKGQIDHANGVEPMFRPGIRIKDHVADAYFRRGRCYGPLIFSGPEKKGRFHQTDGFIVDSQIYIKYVKKYS